MGQKIARNNFEEQETSLVGTEKNMERDPTTAIGPARLPQVSPLLHNQRPRPGRSMPCV